MLFRYDTRAEGALPPSITVITRYKKNWAVGFVMLLLGQLIPKYKYVRFEF